MRHKKFPAAQMQAVEEHEETNQPLKTHDVNLMTQNRLTGEPYDYSEVEAKYGPYERPDKPPITVTLKPKAKDIA